ncbi:MAG: L,D-transpeptidase family protein [Gammaproteobacteria bacterium]
MPVFLTAVALALLSVPSVAAAAAESPEIDALYSAQAYAPIWFSQGHLSAAGAGLLRELGAAESRGLLVSDYDEPSLRRRLAEIASIAPTFSNTPADAIGRLDVALSVAAARIATDLHEGRISPRSVGYELDVPRTPFDAAAAVASLAASENVGAALDALEPQLQHYRLLKSALAQYRALAAPGDTRVQKIVLSLERVRWLPRLDSPPIIVNIPQFRLFAFRTTQDSASDILQMNVIVGSAFKARRTPVFSADMKYVVIHPYWDVPRSILLKELLPGIQADAESVAQGGYEIVRGDSDDALVMAPTQENVERLARGELRLRQKPGPKNALGDVKFIFPNRHNVYLHDTPARSLFNKSRRAFSHGCIRVSDPMALLAHVMRDDPSWTQQRLAAALEGARPVRVQLVKPIRVFILYGTALATESGETLFFDDIYEQDAKLTGDLRKRAALLSTQRARLH